MIDTDKYDFEKALKSAEFTIWNSIVEHQKAEAPTLVITKLRDAREHIVSAMRIMNILHSVEEEE